MSQVQKSSPWICPFFAGFWRFFLWLFLASVEFCGSTGIALALSKSMRRSRHFVECFRQSVTQESSRRQELAENAQQHMKKSVACHCASEGLKRFSRSIDTTATKTELSSPYTPSTSRPPPPRLTHSPPYYYLEVETLSHAWQTLRLNHHVVCKLGLHCLQYKATKTDSNLSIV